MPAPPAPAYLPRAVEPRLARLLAELPAVLLVGPRAVGKTTTGRRFAASVVQLDREAEAVAFRADPDAALRGLREPVLLDEWQAVPGVLGAVKRAVDGDARPGRFIVTGSVRADLEQPTWPGTGRLVRVPMHGLTVRERLRPLPAGAAPGPTWLDRVLADGADALLAPVADAPDLRGYLELALTSGFPEPALRMGRDARAAWLESYLEQLLTRDVALVDAGRDPDRLRRYLTAYAAVTAQVVDDKTLLDAAGISRKTGMAYEQLLKNLFVVGWLPAWSTNRLKQLVRAPKRHVLDPALAAAALGVDLESVMRQGHLIGSLLESFVVAQVRAETSLRAPSPRLWHARTAGGRHEVDLLLEPEPGRLVALEVKATAAPTRQDATHLAWLRDSLGEALIAGVVLHTGPRAWSMERGLHAVPIAALWS